MNSNTGKIGLGCFFVFSALLCLLLILPSGAAVSENRIESVTVDSSGHEITVTAQFDSAYISSDPKRTLYLFALSAGDDASELSALQPLSVVRVAASVTQTVSLQNGKDTLLYARFLFAEKENNSYRAVTNAAYVSNPENTAVSTFDFPEKRSKKGLRIQMSSDAQLLGVSHTVLNVPINRYFAEEETENETISFVHGRKTYYLKKNQVELLDHSVRNYSKAGINCILSILLTAPSSDQAPSLMCLYPDGVAGDEASLFAINTESREAMQYFEAFMEFLAARYTRQDGEFGFAGSFIIGNQVNSNRTGNYMGEKTLSAYVSSYASLLRTAHTAVVSCYKNARVYVSVGNNFNRAAADPSLRENPLLDYAGKVFLDTLAAEIRAKGDFDWRLAVNPYASDPTASDFRADEMAQTDINTPCITMKNIEVLCQYLATADMSFNGNARSILIEDFAVSGEYGTESEAMQAAMFCYAYFKCCAQNQIEALIWHRQTDHPDESGKYGIWTSESSGNSSLVSSKKKLYQCFRYIDTEQINDPEYRRKLFDFVLPLLGVTMWDELLPGFDPKGVPVKAIYEQIPVSSLISEKQYTVRTLFDFSGDSLFGFYPADYVNYIEQHSDPTEGKFLYAQLFPANRAEYRGIADFSTFSFSPEKADYIAVRLYAEMPQDVSKVNIMLRFTGQNGDTEAVFEGIAQASANTWTTIYFPLDRYAELVREAKNMRIWIKAQENQVYEGSCSLCVSKISLYTKTGAAGWKTVIVAAAALTGVIAVGFTVVLLTARRRQRKMHRRREEKRLRMKNGMSSVKYRYRSNRDIPSDKKAPNRAQKKDRAENSHQSPPNPTK